MAFTRLDYEKLWTNEKDFPTYEGSENKVREDMQYHPDAIRTYLNEVLLKELESSAGAGHIGDGQKGNLADTLVEIFRHFEENDQDIRDLAAGESPEAVRAARVEFDSTGWVLNSGTGRFEMRLIQGQHTRRNDAFGYTLRCLSDGEYVANSWAAAGTDVAYAADSGDIILTAENAYDGVIVFFGV